MKRSTKLDFIRQGEALTHIQSRLITRWGLLLVPLTLAVLVLCPRNRPNAASDEPTPSFYIALTCLFGFGIAAMAHLSASERRLVRRCPECRRRFTPFTAALAVASDRCGECGACVFEDDWCKESSSESPFRTNARSGRLTRHREFIEQDRVRERRRDRATMIALAVGMTSVFATTAAVISMTNNDDLTHLAVRIAILALLTPLHVLLVVAGIRLGVRRGVVPVQRGCPDCRRPLSPMWRKIALVTHHCCHCGGRVIAEDL